jgi:hypothetical protein
MDKAGVGDGCLDADFIWWFQQQRAWCVLVIGTNGLNKAWWMLRWELSWQYCLNSCCSDRQQKIESASTRKNIDIILQVVGNSSEKILKRSERAKHVGTSQNFFYSVWMARSLNCNVK